MNFKNFNDLVKNITLDEVLQQIKSEPKLKIRIETLRKHLAEGNKTAYDQAKKSLIAFTPSGTFANGRKADLLETYTQYIILDIDKLDIETLQNIKNIAQEIPYTLTCFTSPSGAGIKIIVEVDSESADHCHAYNQVKTFYEAQLQQTIDPSGKDVSRLCFYSYDPDIFINENHLIFEIEKGIQELFEDKKLPVLPPSLDALSSPSLLGKVGMGLCSDQDFFIAQQLTKVYIEHSICIFEKLPKSEGGLVIRNRANIKNVFFAILPNVFGYQEAAELAEKFEITTRTVRNYLHSFTEANFLIKEDHGLYRKVEN